MVDLTEGTQIGVQLNHFLSGLSKSLNPVSLPFLKMSRPVGSGLALGVLQLDPWSPGSVTLHDTLRPTLSPVPLMLCGYQKEENEKLAPR